MIPTTHIAYFKTREDAERCAAELGGEYLSAVEMVEAPWRLRAARPAPAHDATVHDGEVERVASRHGGEYDGPDQPLEPDELPPFRFSSEDDAE